MDSCTSRPIGSLADVSTGVLYKNSAPYLKSVHAYFPSVVILPDDELLATYVLGEAFEAINLRVNVSRSCDFGKTWQHEGVVTEDSSDRIISEFCRLMITPEGELVVILSRCDRTDHPDMGLANPENFGFTPMKFATIRSSDLGRTWTEPAAIEPPLVGPTFELCAPITILSDGRWVLPTSTWRGWDGDLPNGNRMVGFVSEDNGNTWPTYMDVMTSPDDSLMFWESKIVELSDGRLLAIAWCYDEKAKCDLPNHYAISHDGGNTWSAPQSTGLTGQTLTPMLLSDDRILSVYRRMDKPGLWANFSHLDGDVWVNDACESLWGHNSDAGTTNTDKDMSKNFQTLKFGAPCMCRLPDGTIFLAFWCYEDNVGIIRWFKFTAT